MYHLTGFFSLFQQVFFVCLLCASLCEELEHRQKILTCPRSPGAHRPPGRRRHPRVPGAGAPRQHPSAIRCRQVPPGSSSPGPHCPSQTCGLLSPSVRPSSGSVGGARQGPWEPGSPCGAARWMPPALRLSSERRARLRRTGRIRAALRGSKAPAAACGRTVSGPLRV